MRGAHVRHRHSQAAAAMLLRHERIDERLRALPDRAAMLANGFDNADGDATLLFEGLPYRDVMTVALRDPRVRDALARLPAGWSGWAR
jgi:hypothetical protein